MAKPVKGFVIAAPHSGSGKTLVTLGLARAFKQAGLTVSPAKSGPDYIDQQFLSRSAGKPCVNLDAWAMSSERLQEIATQCGENQDLLLVEGVMGLFDGAQGGGGSTADLAAVLGLPAVLVIDASHMAQSVAAIAAGFRDFRADVHVAGVILNRVASDKHEMMLRDALNDHAIVCFGAIRRDVKLSVPSRHLGLTLPSEIAEIETIIETAAVTVRAQIDMDRLLGIAGTLAPRERTVCLPPLGQHIAIARDAAFSFIYEHWLGDWRARGASVSFFSPLADEAPDVEADAVFLPGGYPELHAETLSNAQKFKTGLRAVREQGALIYGECGGYMVLGSALTDKNGVTHAMTGLLPHATKIDKPRRILGFRKLTHKGPLPFALNLRAHEFHYSSQNGGNAAPLFEVQDARGNQLADMGGVVGKVCGSYAHVIDEVRQ